MQPALASLLPRLRDAARRHPELRLLLLFGSQARGDATARSDWDLGFVASAELDFFGLLTDLVTELGTDRVDLVDLDRTSAVLRYRAARDGLVMHEHEGAHAHFWSDAVHFWCDAGPMIRAAHDQVLRELRA